MRLILFVTLLISLPLNAQEIDPVNTESLGSTSAILNQIYDPNYQNPKTIQESRRQDQQEVRRRQRELDESSRKGFLGDEKGQGYSGQGYTH